eukprot:1903794-Pleurochrysis_carterae.AAC.1
MKNTLEQKFANNSTWTTGWKGEFRGADGSCSATKLATLSCCASSFAAILAARAASSAVTMSSLPMPEIVDVAPLAASVDASSNGVGRGWAGVADSGESVLDGSEGEHAGIASVCDDDPGCVSACDGAGGSLVCDGVGNVLVFDCAVGALVVERVGGAFACR